MDIPQLEKKIEQLEERVSRLEGNKVVPEIVAQEQPSNGVNPIAYVGLIVGALILLGSVPGLLFSVGYGLDPLSFIGPVLGLIIGGAGLYAILKHNAQQKENGKSGDQVQADHGTLAYHVEVSEAGTLEKKSTQNVEFKIASSWFAVVGIVAIILGVGFFLKFAFDNRLIGPVGQVSIGLVFGLILIGAGELLRSKYPKYSFVISGGGIVVLYLSLWASNALFNLTSQIVSLGGMGLVTAASALLAIRYKAVPIAILGVAGGFAAPILLGKGVDNQFLLMTYVVILNLGVLVVAIFENWQRLNILSFAGTYLVFFVWYSSYYTKGQLWPTLVFETILFLIFGLVMFVYNVVNNKKTQDTDVLMMFVNAILYFGIFYMLLNPDYHFVLGGFAFVLSLFYFFLGYISLGKFNKDNVLTLGFLGISILFLTVAVPLQVKQNIITVIWSIEAIVILLVGFWLDSYKLRVAALAIYILVAIRLVGFDTKLPYEEFSLILNRRFGTFLAAAFSMGAAAYLFRKFKQKLNKDEWPLFAVLVITLNIVLVWALSFESVSYFGKRIQALNGGVLAQQSVSIPLMAGGNNTVGCAIPAGGNINLGASSACPNSMQRFKFEGVSIPKGSKINSAILQFTPAESSADVIYLKINLDANYSQGQFPYTPWNVTQPWVSGQPVTSSDFALMVQPLVDSQGWTGVGSVNVNIDPGMKVARRVVYPAGNAGFSPRLIIVFDSTAVTTYSAPVSQNSTGNYSSPSPYIRNQYSNYQQVASQPPLRQDPLTLKKVKDLESARDVSLSIIWGIYSILLILIGIVTKYKPIRLAAMAFFAVTIFKVFLFDSRNLQTGYRIIAFMGLGAILLTVSLVYQKHKDKIGEFLK